MAKEKGQPYGEDTDTSSVTNVQGKEYCIEGKNCYMAMHMLQRANKTTANKRMLEYLHDGFLIQGESLYPSDINKCYTLLENRKSNLDVERTPTDLGMAFLQDRGERNENEMSHRCGRNHDLSKCYAKSM